LRGEIAAKLLAHGDLFFEKRREIVQLSGHYQASAFTGY
jgi:hypothetical protein